MLETILAKRLPARAPIGEIWTVWDELPVTNGPLRGQILKEIVRRDAAAWLGCRSDDNASTPFPLLVKLLDAQENLSIQVHPDDDYARQREGQPYGKCEVWYVVAAEPGASFFHGPRSLLSQPELRNAIETGGLVEALARVEVAPGDVVLNQPGTIHALGGGIVLYELQQSCDLTYRLYDWDRGQSDGRRRALHVDQGVEVSDLRPIAAHKITPITLDEADHQRTILCACRHFAAELLVPRAERVALHPYGGFDLLTALDGKLQLRWGSSAASRLALGPGDSALVPAALREYSLLVTAPPGHVIRAYVPDLTADIVEPLRARGVPADKIRQLGGDPDRSDLAGFMV
jgi:mannose-6-phosphate isomerase